MGDSHEKDAQAPRQKKSRKEEDLTPELSVFRPSATPQPFMPSM